MSCGCSLQPHFEKLNELLADLHVWNAKLHNLHWNVEGVEFMQVHQFTESLYEWAFESLDTVAELLKIKGALPFVKIEDYAKNSHLKELASQKFSTKEVLETVYEDAQYFHTAVLEIRKLASEKDDFDIVNLMEDYASKLAKDLWFLRAMLSK